VFSRGVSERNTFKRYSFISHCEEEMIRGEELIDNLLARSRYAA